MSTADGKTPCWVERLTEEVRMYDIGEEHRRWLQEGSHTPVQGKPRRGRDLTRKGGGYGVRRLGDPCQRRGFIAVGGGYGGGFVWLLFLTYGSFGFRLGCLVLPLN